MPFAWMHGVRAIVTSIAASAAALGTVGLLSSLFNGRSPWFSAARQAVFGCAAAATTYGIGSLLGVSLSQSGPRRPRAFPRRSDRVTGTNGAPRESVRVGCKPRSLTGQKQTLWFAS
jgi:VIT family